jgi:p-hydroxybenzoate 3-monooxygenase
VRTQIGIIGAGPAGMFLALPLRSLGIERIVVEQRDRAYVGSRVRAGILEQSTVELMHRLGVGERVAREGLVHRGTKLGIDGRLFHLDFAALTAGKTVTVYGKQEVMRGLYDDAEQLQYPAAVWLIAAAFALRLPRNITRTGGHFGDRGSCQASPCAQGRRQIK